jgi:hypothetical protein
MRRVLREYSLTWGYSASTHSPGGYSASTHSPGDNPRVLTHLWGTPRVLTHSPGVCLVPGPALDDQPTPAHAQPAAAPAPKGAASATAPSQAAAEVARPTEAMIAPVAAEVASTRSGADEAPAGGADAAAPRSAPLASALLSAATCNAVATSCIMRAVCDVSRHRVLCVLFAMCRTIVQSHSSDGQSLGIPQRAATPPPQPSHRSQWNSRPCRGKCFDPLETSS